MLLLLKNLNLQGWHLNNWRKEKKKVYGICFNFDSKYNKGHKCGEKKLFYIDCEEEEEEEEE